MQVMKNMDKNNPVSLDILRYLVENGINLDTRSVDGLTVFDLVSYDKHTPEIIDYFISILPPNEFLYLQRLRYERNPFSSPERQWGNGGNRVGMFGNGPGVYHPRFENPTPIVYSMPLPARSNEPFVPGVWRSPSEGGFGARAMPSNNIQIPRSRHSIFGTESNNALPREFHFGQQN